MDFKVGDTVLVIDEAFSGVIKSISQIIRFSVINSFVLPSISWAQNL